MRRCFAVVLTAVLALSLFIPAAAQEQVTLNLWHRWGGGNEALVQQVVDAFMAVNPDV